MLSHSVTLTAPSGRTFPARASRPINAPFKAVVAPNTSHSGHVEIATDPSYRGQIVLLAHPTAGAARGQPQSERAWLSAVIAAEFPPSSQLLELLDRDGVVAIAANDHAALVAERPVWLTVSQGVPPSDLSFADSSSAATSCLAPSERGAGPLVVVADFGCKVSLIDQLVCRGFRVRCVPPESFEGALEGARAAVVSSGPGDPRQLGWFSRAALRAQETLPLLGICLGHQLIALANSCEISRLARGHHGSNRAAVSLVDGSVSITSHNHAFTVASPSQRVSVTHVDAADGSIEGIRISDARWTVGVQFHPEGGPGPIAGAVLDQFALAARGRV